MPQFQVDELSFTAKLFGFLDATAKLKRVSASNDVKNLLEILRSHRALYDPYQLEIVGGAANSIRGLRGRLEGVTYGDGFADECRGLILKACKEFQSEIEAMSANRLHSPSKIYDQQITMGNMEDMSFGMFGTYLGELRNKVNIVLEAMKKKGVQLPAELE